MREFLKVLETHNPIRISFSLPCRGIENIKFLYSQALYALNSGKTLHPEEQFSDFFDYALNYLIESGSLEDSVRACMPGVIHLWKMQQKQKDDLFLSTSPSTICISARYSSVISR